MQPRGFPKSFPVKENGQGKQLSEEAQKNTENGLQKLKSRRDSMES
jgi:hypothetical protein